MLRPLSMRVMFMTGKVIRDRLWGVKTIDQRYSSARNGVLVRSVRMMDRRKR